MLDFSISQNRMEHTLRQWMIFSALAISTTAFSEFNATNRSVNGTGETLNAHQCEVGLRALSCGVSDDFMLTSPTLSILTGESELEARYRFQLPENVRITPALIAGSPVHFGARIDFGINLGADLEHSLTFTTETNWAAKGDIPVPKYSPDRAYRFTSYLGGEYDYYNFGNVAYIGVSRRVPYVGYTWAWEHFHLGIITSNLSRYFPVPYFYWRF